MTRLHARCLTLISFWSCAALLAVPTLGRTATVSNQIERWDIFEIILVGPTSGDPYLNVHVSATFSQGDQRITVPGFWDGGDTYKIRFSPHTTGEWRYHTHSGSPTLSGKSGVLRVTRPTGNNHGPIEIFDTFYLRYADGTPYHQFGTTCYAWVHQTCELQAQTLKTLADSPFNKIRFCVFPKAYVYNKNEPEFFAFKKGVNGKFDFSRPNPAFWRHFEQRILDLQRLGIEADLILWHPYDRWGFADMSDDEDDRYLRYCIARLSAFRNVWWSLANEYDFMTNQPRGHRGNKQWEDWDRFFSILRKEDPHQRLRGIHNGRKWYDHTKDWVTHASLQTSNMEGGVDYRAQYQKPILYDECKYEGNIPQGWGNISAREMIQRFWLGTMSGCYVGHGETYKHAQDILWWAKGGVLHGKSPKRIQWLKDFLAEAPAFHELKPLGNDKGTVVLAKEGEYYLVYCQNQSAKTVRLSGTRPYKVDRIDPWDMTVLPVGTASAGEYTVSAPKPDQVYRFVPYRPGEKLRPEARIEVSASEGLPPLKVVFASAAGGRAQWDFGDGTTSHETNPTHVFQKAGLYTVKLTVTDASGSSAVAFQSIAVEQEVTAPFLRVGLPGRNEVPRVTLEGTARRSSDGSFHLPDGEPWGWVQVDDGPLEDVRGLRSFTVMGWLKPESLQVGSGGNRILFCLKGSRSGIDLVCHSDGRLRLSVNEWPDSVRNDSSPGKLKLGKWTFFAVSYNAIASEDNVSWYFSTPMDAPKPATVTLDRRNTYNAGPVGRDIGPLVIGNFNETMRGYGLDRQFRGGIRALQMFGSPVGRRGALEADEISKHGQYLLSASKHKSKRLRVIATSDGEIDDECSMVRFLLYANEWDIEGIVTSSSQYHWQGHRWAGDDWIKPYLDAYAQVYPNLVKHDPAFPTPEYLRERAVLGNVKAEGEMEEVTAGSQFIVKVLLNDTDDRPIWLQAWGGPNTIARALKTIEEKHSERMADVAKKMRFFFIWEQDSTYQDYIRPRWGKYNIPTIVSDQFIAFAYHWEKILPKQTHDVFRGDWMNRHILKDHGPLCALYKAHDDGRFRSEGDSPAFMHSILTGLRSMESPDWGGWGGRYVRVRENTWLDPVLEPGYEYPEGRWYTSNAWGRNRMRKNIPNDQELIAYLKPMWRWFDAIQNDFAARADWCVKPFDQANHAPVVKLAHALDLKVRPGKKVSLSAKGSTDPDGDPLTYRWWQYQEADTYQGTIEIINADKQDASFTVPGDGGEGRTIHIICEVTDNGTPPLTRYRRVVVEIE